MAAEAARNLDSGASLLRELLTKLGVHEHLCLIYGTQEGRLAAAVPFVKIGLERGERCLSIADGNMAATLLDHMRKQQVMVDAAIKKGSLTITDPEIGLLHDDFDPDRIIGALLSEPIHAFRSACTKVVVPARDMAKAKANLADMPDLREEVNGEQDGHHCRSLPDRANPGVL